MNRTSLLILAAAAIAALAIVFWQSSGPPRDKRVAVKLPATFSAEARQGQELFAANCAKCHGTNAGGTDNGPPLIHQIYRPGHHADGSFYRAAREGARAHHWMFGDMPPVARIDTEQVTKIIRYVRELQRENGIF